MGDGMTSQDIRPDWIAVDWGTSRLRTWAMSGNSIEAQAQSDAGMGRLTPDQFEPALLELINDWLVDKTNPTPVIACGMVGARQGWIEAPYQPVPAKPLDAVPIAAPTRDDRLQVWLICGMSQVEPPDVMRGEETQIAGFLALNPDWDGVICLPGTHSKWAQISAGEVVSFQTFMTGELFALISQESVLRHSVGKTGHDEAAFLAAMDDILARPERLAARLFSLRARDLVHGTAPEQARSQLSGLLIGAELAAARPYWLGQQLALIGPDDMTRLYASALNQLGAPAIQTDATRMTLAGLTSAWRNIQDSA